eukprot:CCRYP_015711-RA/>CCRYP_015711-RA protein AED:0.05 eAED:0.05 QI:335/1/1/1/0.5/0.33/3/4488/602
MRTISLTILGILHSPSCAFAPPNRAVCNASPSPFLVSKNIDSSTRSSIRLAAKNDFPTPLATEGDWSAYLDEDTTGFVYYFNGVTGESSWTKPTETFPDVTSDAKTSKEKKKEGGGILGALFGSDRKKSADSPSGTTQQQLLDLEKIASNNDDFLSELDDVIAEAEEAIKIAEDLENEPASKRGGLFSAFGFGKKEATVESLIADVEERTSKIEKAVGGEEKKGLFSSLRFGGSKSNVEKKEEEVTTTAPQPEENVWVEGLKNLFQRTYASFSPPKLKTTPDKKKVVAVEEENAASAASQPKAKVSDSDFLDVIWGAETSARPTLNIAEMMKAFQVQTQETTVVTEQAVEGAKALSLDMAMQVKPHPEKISWGGEDAVFLNGRNFGVFDGVSGAEKVRGKKLYSVSLAESMKKQSLANKSSWTVSEITNCMNEAKEVADAEGTGASTAVVASIGQDNVLRALNLGDSVCLVVRDGAVAARTREIIHYFDCPYQLGGDSPDRPKDGTTLETTIYPGDIIIAGSDGVFDNLSDGDILDLVSGNANVKSNVLAKKICEASRAVSLDYDAVTPYSRAARGRSGYAAYQSGRGGKVDDISCVVVKAS